ncbi:MAG: divalent-cation tolerance protein CutA [Pirellulaceae bacterium]|nr:divalent-cation tolerance protein CutA [Pirellulaceae bacterium]
MHASPALILVITTSDNLSTLEAISRELLEQHLVACVQISSPVTSHYRWEGVLTQSAEFLLTAKSRAELFPAIQTAIRSRHNYELPEILVLRAEASEDYHRWVLRETKSLGDLRDEHPPTAL